MQEKKTIVLYGALLFVLFTTAVAVLKNYSVLVRKAESKKGALARFVELEEVYLKKKGEIEPASRRAFAADAGSALSLIEKAGEAAGIKSKISSVQQVDEKEVLGYSEKVLSIQVEKVDLSQLVNFLFILEKGNALLVTREFSMKSRFEHPKLYDVRIKLSHVRKNPA